VPDGASGDTGRPGDAMQQGETFLQHRFYSGLQPSATRLGFRDWMQQLGLKDPSAAREVLERFLEDGVPPALLLKMLHQASSCLPHTTDPQGVLETLERFIRTARTGRSIGDLFAREPDVLPMLLQMFSVSPYLSEQLIRSPDAFDAIRRSRLQPVDREILIDEICCQVDACKDESQILQALRSYRHRETVRIASNDFVGGMPVDLVAQQLSDLADAICEAAYRAAWKATRAQYGRPLRPDGSTARWCVLAMGKLGGRELNYSSDIDLMFLGDLEGCTEGPRVCENTLFFDQLAKRFTRWLGDSHQLRHAYRVDLRLRPYGKSGPLVIDLPSAWHYYETMGRTWERQAMLKARAVAGDTQLGDEFLERLRPWILGSYLTRADIAGIRAIKRNIERSNAEGRSGSRNIKTGRGGIRDVEFVIQFLQLLHASQLESLPSGNTLLAIVQLERAGCLTPQERSLLETNYRFLRRVEHALQIVFDAQTHTLPESPEEMKRLAIRLGYRDFPGDQQLPARSVTQQLQAQLSDCTELNRRILNHLLHEPFGEEGEVSQETDLLLDPAPTEQRIASVLALYRLVQPLQAFEHLQELARETVPFLSSSRCRHFLSAIANRLLTEIAATPDPDRTLVNLVRISNSIGGKAVLWELLSEHPPTLRLCIRIGACSEYLVEMLASHPGMIDDLMDSLMLGDLPSIESLREELRQLSQGATRIEPILQGFKRAAHLRIGVRDLLGKDSMEATHRCLSDVAEVCLELVVGRTIESFLEEGSASRLGQDAKEVPLVLVALGKLGGQEPNYHSDLDLLFLYDPQQLSETGETPEAHSDFHHLAQSILQGVNRIAAGGKLYDLDVRLRPHGDSGPLALSLHDLETYFQSSAQLWERLMLCKARVVWGNPTVRRRAEETICRILDSTRVDPADAGQLVAMREKMQSGASLENLKRGEGGTVDVEFLVQWMQLKHGKSAPSLRATGTLAALREIAREGLLPSDDCQQLAEGYAWLRRVESGLRLMNTVARHDLPSDPRQLDRLAFLLDQPTGQQLLDRCHATRQRLRSLFLKHLGSLSS